MGVKPALNSVVDWKALQLRIQDAKAWGEGESTLGRFSYRYTGGTYTFYFKNRRDILTFKLAWGGA